MIFALGFITGLLISILIVATLTYFRRVLETKVTTIERLVESKGPKPKGFIYEPPSEADDIRAQIIAKNKKEGKDTPISELQ